MISASLLTPDADSKEKVYCHIKIKIYRTITFLNGIFPLKTLIGGIKQMYKSIHY